MATLFNGERLVALDSNGKVIAGRSSWFYQTGTTTLQTVYADAGATVDTCQPGGRGRRRPVSRDLPRECERLQDGFADLWGRDCQNNGPVSMGLAPAQPSLPRDA